MSGHLYTGTKSIANYLCVILLLVLSGCIKLNPALSPNSSVETSFSSMNSKLTGTT